MLANYFFFFARFFARFFVAFFFPALVLFFFFVILAVHLHPRQFFELDHVRQTFPHNDRG